MIAMGKIFPEMGEAMQQVTRKELDTGVGLTCVTTGRFKRAVMRVALLLPLGGADAARRACMPQVLRRGTETLPDLQAIGRALDEKYGARIESMVRKEGETLCIGFLADCIEERFAPGAAGLAQDVIAMLMEMLYRPRLQDGVFRTDYVESERTQLLDRIAAQKNDPMTYAPRRQIELMCSGEAYAFSALGTAEQAAQITENRLFPAWKRALDEARIELFYCGSAAPDTVAGWFAHALPTAHAAARYQPHIEVRAVPDGPVREVIEQEPVTQGKLAIGFRMGGNCLTAGDPAACWLFQTAFGGSTSSRLFVNVREKQSLCYYASAQFIASKGIMQVNSGIENDKFEVTRDEILHQLALCQADDLTDDEIESARRTLTTNWRAMLDDPILLERYWLGQAVAGTLISPEQRVEQLAGVTRARVLQAAQAAAPDLVYFMKGAAQ